MLSAVPIVARLASELVGWVALAFQSRQLLHAEVLFLRRQPTWRPALVDVPEEPCARGIVACDFFVTVTSTFRLLYVLVVIEHRSRRLIHSHVTAHPTAAWTRQPLRQALGFDTHYGLSAS